MHRQNNLITSTQVSLFTQARNSTVRKKRERKEKRKERKVTLKPFISVQKKNL